MLNALFYDGLRAESIATVISRSEDHLLFEIAGESHRYTLAGINLRPAIGRIPMQVELPDGGLLEIADTAAASEFFRQRHGWVERLEAHWRYVLLSVLVTVFALWASWFWGLPWAADRASVLVPPEWEQKLGAETLEALDEHWFTPTTLPVSRQNELRQLLAHQPGLPAGCCQLVFRESEAIGANALALPGGTLLVTDDLVALAHDDAEIIAVLLHEVGHIEERHSVRMLLRASGVGVMVALLSGDVGTLGNVLASAPAVLMQLSYSRAFEEEADAAALRRLVAGKIPACHFTDILQRIGAQSPASDAIPRWLMTHPDTERRTKRFGEACRKVNKL